MDLYQRDQVYRLDQATMQYDAQPSRQLMQKAALAVWRAITQRWQELRHIVIVVGAGNNGGDGFAIALLAHDAGVRVTLIMRGDLQRQSEESAYYREQWTAAGGEISEWQGECPACDLVVDGLLGIGLDKPLDDDWMQMIQAINTQPAPRVSIDIPSGLNADTGCAMPRAIRADLTVSFIGRKIGCWLADGPDYCGELVFDDLGISRRALATETPACKVLDSVRIQLPAPRSRNSHKNHFGHVLVLGGARGMSGAARLAGMAALRAGSGLVSLCVHQDNYAASAAADPELMIGTWGQLGKMLERADVVVVGPGLGLSREAVALLQRLFEFRGPMVIDADALHADFLDIVMAPNRVITPHPGEAARLLERDSSAIQADRFAALAGLTERWAGVSVLKGSGSLIGQREQAVALCSNGHAGMATAGAGDVLSGFIAALLAQDMAPLEAAQSAVLLHALAADAYAGSAAGETLVASDLIHGLGSVWHRLRALQGGGLR